MLNGIGGTDPGRSARRNRFYARLASAILVLAVLFVAATERVEAAYPTTLDPFTVTVSGVTCLNFGLEEAANWEQTDPDNDYPNGLYTMVSYGRVQYNASWAAAGDDNTWQTSMVEGQFELNFAITNPTVTGFTFSPVGFEVMEFEHDQGIYSKTHATYINSGSAGRALVTFYKICDRPQFGSYLDFKIVTTYRAVDTGANPKNLTTVHPTVTVTVGSGGASSVNWAQLIDPNGYKLFDPDTGWLPIMNTNLQSMVTNQITGNAWMQTVSGQVTQVNSHLAGIRQNQQSQLANEATMIAMQNEIIDNQETQIGQLQVIVDYVSNTKAADVIEDANDSFVNNAGALESGQADLENAADASLAAVDFSKVGLISTFSQSVNWWMRCVNFLPTGTGAIWDVLVFGFLIAFVMFILRLVR